MTRSNRNYHLRMESPTFRSDRNAKARSEYHRKCASPAYKRLQFLHKRVFRLREQIEVHMARAEKADKELLKRIAERELVSAKWQVEREGYLKRKSAA